MVINSVKELFLVPWVCERIDIAGILEYSEKQNSHLTLWLRIIFWASIFLLLLFLVFKLASVVYFPYITLFCCLVCEIE